MKKTTRILSVLMALLMLVGIAPMAAFAEEPIVITSLEFEATVDKPVVGAATYTPTLVSVNGQASLTSLVSVDNIAWHYADEYTTNGNVFKTYSQSTFADNKAYDLYINIIAQDGAYFSDECECTLETPNNYYYGTMFALVGGTNIGFDFFFLDLVKTKITSIELEANAVPAYDAPVFEPEVVSVNGDKALADLISEIDTSWYYNYAESTDGNDYDYYYSKTFDRGWAYDMFVDAYCVESAMFTDDCTFTLKTPKGTVNGYFYDEWGSDNFAFDFFFFDLLNGFPIKRLYGSSRYETADRIFDAEWGGAESIVLASGENYPDALAGTVLAYTLSAPILLTAKSSLSEDTLGRIYNSGAETIYILGGTAAISQSIEDELSEYFNVTRVYGNSRNATAAEIASLIAADDEVFIVSNESFADALSAGTIAALKGSPILYANRNGSLPAETVAAIQERGCTKAYIIGGTAAVASAAETNLDALGVETERIFGNDRQLTSIEVFNKFVECFDDSEAAIATGKNFPDALAGVALTARRGIPLFLVVDSAPAALHTTFGKMDLDYFWVFGGTGVVSRSIVDDLADRLESSPTPMSDNSTQPLLNSSRKQDKAA